MRVLNISEFKDSIVLHFQTDGERINAYTLASTLVAVADSAKAANQSINPGYDVEIVVEALGSGSFRAKIKSIYTTANNLFSGRTLQVIALAIIANYVYERTLSLDDSVRVEVRTDEVIIERGEERLIVPRTVYDATRNVEKDPQFTKAISRTLEAMRDDDKIQSFGIVKDMRSPKPDIVVPRSVMQSIVSTPSDETSVRVIEEQCSLQILKAILEKSRRKWEFVWRGVKISAPIVDDKFYSDFSSHKITIAPGDELKVKLAIKQERDEATGIFTNVGYQVTEVYEHIPGIKQDPLEYE